MGLCVSIRVHSRNGMIVFNTDGIAGGSAGTWRGAYEYTKFRHQVMMHLKACGIFVCLRRHLLLGPGPSHGLHAIWYDIGPIQRV